MTKKTLPTAPVANNYEEAQAQLEELLARIEAQEIPLNELLAAYERAQSLIDYCREQLRSVEVQIQRVDAN